MEATVRHYYETVNMAVSTGDTQQLRALSNAGCGCRELVSDIDRVYANGRSEGARFEVETVHPRDIQGVTAAADVSYHVTPYKVMDRAGSLLQQVGEYRGHDLLSFQLVGGRWLLVNAHHLGQR